MQLKLLIQILLLFAAIIVASGCVSRQAQKTAPPIGELVEIAGETMHVLDIGPKDAALPPVLLIHGASVNLRDMKIALGDALAENRRVIMIDRPGRGYSTRPEDGHRLELQARYLRWTLDHLGVENPIVVGQSFGGSVALSYALQYQDEMAGLVLLAPVSHEWSGGVAWYNRLSNTPVAGFILRRTVVPYYGRLSAEDGVEASFEPGEPPANYAEEAGVSLLFRPKDFRANASDLARLKPQILDQQQRYGALDLPVAIVSGAADDTVPPDVHAKILAEDVDGATLTLLPETGHALHHARSAEILEIIDAMSLVSEDRDVAPVSDS
ncbi:MAG: alpha/beta hydrolase [Pseudomonadota bacterium]